MYTSVKHDIHHLYCTAVVVKTLISKAKTAFAEINDKTIN